MRTSVLSLLSGLWLSAAVLAMPVAARAAPADDAHNSLPNGLSALARLLIGVADGRPTGLTAVTRLTGTSPTTDLALGNACREVTRAGPFLLDTATRLEGCRGEHGKRVVFHLSLFRFDASREGTAAFMASARPALVRGICRNPDVPVLGRLGIALIFQYTGINQQPVGEVSISPGGCDSA